MTKEVRGINIGKKNIYKKSLFITIPVLLSILLTYLVSGDSYIYTIFIETFCASIGTALFLICIINKYKEISYYRYVGMGIFFLSILSFIYALVLNTTKVNENYFFENVITFSSYNLSYILVILSFLLYKKRSTIKKSLLVYTFTIVFIVLINSYFILTKIKWINIIGYDETIILLVLIPATLICIRKNRKNLKNEEMKYLYLYIIFLMLSQLISFFNKLYESSFSYEVGIFKYVSYFIMFDAINKFLLNKSYNEIRLELENAESKQINLNKRLKDRKKLIVESKSQIEKNEKRYRTLIDSIRDGILIFSSDRLYYINEKALKILGYNEEKFMLGTRIEFILRRLTDYDISYSDKKILSQNYFKIENVRKDDNEYEVYLLKMDKFNRLLYIKNTTEINKNIKVRKEYDNYLKKEKVKNNFYSNISHELRTPINIIYSALQLNEVNLKEEQIEPLIKRNKVIRQNCLRLIRTINNFIDTNRISEGYLKPNMKVYNIVSVIENVSMECISYFEKIDGTIIFDSTEEEIFVECDKDMIERIILNLLSNSLKHGKKGEKVYIYIEEDADIVVVHVNNNGYTIDKSMQPYIFDKFTKINKSLNREKEGSGLGLYLVKALLELQGGTIEFKSKCKVGSEFIIKLPKCYEEEKVEYEYEMKATREKVDMEFSDIYL